MRPRDFKSFKIFMRYKKALKNLTEILEKWGITYKDFIFTGRLSPFLLGYKVEKKGTKDFLFLVNKEKVPWKVGRAYETFPPRNSLYFKSYRNFMRKSGFGIHFYAEAESRLKRAIKRNSLLYRLGGKKLYISSLLGHLKELSKFISAQCKKKKVGEEKGLRLLNYVERLSKIAERKNEIKLVKECKSLLKKFNFLIKEKGKEKILIKNFFKNKVIKGIKASKGEIKGKVKVILRDEFYKIRKGEVLVTPTTSPLLAPYTKRIIAIITDEGGLTCHAAIISRELKIPCIIGTKIATKVLHDGDLVEVDAERGVVKILKKGKK